MKCHHYEAKRCQSCSWIDLEYSTQIEQKESHLHRELQRLSGANDPNGLNGYPHQVNSLDQLEIIPSKTSPQTAFRNKAKMVALGAAHQPILGIINHNDEIVSLTDCPLYSSEMQALLKYLESWIQKAGIPPYNIEKRKGELKYIIVHQNQEGKFLIRFVLRSLNRLDRIKSHTSMIQEAFPSVEVMSLNLQPEHQAILEGLEEIYLTSQEFLTESLNEIPLCVQPGCFFQTNSTMAESLYKSAALWIQNQLLKMKITSTQDPPQDTHPDRIHLVDLFCGVGGFGLTISHFLEKTNSYHASLTGIEISPYAKARAKWTADQIEFSNIQFETLDLTQDLQQEASLGSAADVLIVNPPRRGIGSEVCQWIEATAPKLMIYSSCQSESMMTDIALLPSYQMAKIQIFDMFPHSSHYETLCLLIHQEAL